MTTSKVSLKRQRLIRWRNYSPPLEGAKRGGLQHLFKQKKPVVEGVETRLFHHAIGSIIVRRFDLYHTSLRK